MNDTDNITFLNENLLNVFDWHASFTEYCITKKLVPRLTDNLKNFKSSSTTKHKETWSMWQSRWRRGHT